MTEEALTERLLEAERIRSERRINRVRAIVLVLLAAGAALYSTQLTPELNRVNLALLVPMLLWTLGQELAYYQGWGAPRSLSRVNPIVDTTALTVLLAGYGAFGGADMAIKSPMFLAYFVILATQPLTSSPRQAAAVAVLAIVEYAVLVGTLLLAGQLPMLGSPLETATTSGTTLFDEGARLLMLALVGGAVTYGTSRHERTLRGAVAMQVQHDAEERALVIKLQEADKLAAVGTLAATVAHEVNNPLASIVLLADLLKESELTPGQREDVEGILVASQRTAEIVRELLRISRQREEREQEVSLSVLAEQALLLLRPMLRDQNVAVETRLEDGLPSVTTRGSRLEQVVLNLNINAVQAMEAQSGPKVLCLSTGRDSSQVWLAVEDSGTGIPPDVAGRIFERFFTTKPEGKGTGLGLWIVKEIMAEHGGSIEASNREAGGARFTLRFPIDGGGGDAR